MKSLSVKDALILEENEQMQALHGRTRRAIHDTYGRKQATKKRRKLPGKRTWKDKRRQYAKLEGKMSMEAFNNRSKVRKVLDKVYKQQAEEAAKKQAEQIKQISKDEAKAAQKRRQHSLQ